MKGRGKGIRPNVFTGLKILGFNWAMVGPLTMKYFADYGATVVRIETALRPDVSRMSAPYKDRKPGINNAIPTAQREYARHGLNMASARLGVAEARRLSGCRLREFHPGCDGKWGLGWGTRGN
jgi:benzylsuccinate CoA-transferase BbsF subunit